MSSEKNPYLFKAKDINTAQDFVTFILDAHLSSQEETIFGGFLEELAIFICSQVYSGQKSAAEGIDYAKVVNKFTAEFIGKYCDAEGNMLWEEIVKFNSADTTS